jgi:enamine deaminase RidA (YjgF/YER057c/UK114 family)
MKRRRILAVSVGMLVLGGLLLASGGPGVTPAGAQNPTPQQQQLRQILDKLDQVLAATKAGSGAGERAKSSSAEDNHTLRWDQVLPVSQRFVILPAFNSDAVLDKETGLVWEKSPQATAVSSANVRLTCINKAVGGRKGWRLPSLPELASLVDPSVTSPGPTLPPGHPFVAVQSANYWSASANAENPSLMWGVGFNNGAVLGLSKAFDQRAWCVRGGMSAD